MMREEELKKEGWTLASATSGAHLERALEMYRELGIEFLLEKVGPEQCGECALCYQAGGETIYRIYTRAKDEEEP